MRVVVENKKYIMLLKGNISMFTEADIKHSCAGHATPEEIKRFVSIENILLKKPDEKIALLHKAILLFEPFHQREEGSKIFDLLNVKYPDFVDAYFWHAECLFGSTGSFPLGEKKLIKALEIDYNRADCHMLLASIMETLDRDDSKIEVHHKMAVKLEPTWPVPRLFYANFLFKKNQLQEARIMVQEALAHLLDPVPTTDDSIVEHYETLVTGRYCEDIKKTLLDFSEEIDQAIQKTKGA
jgi:hypothetical protein